MISTSPRPSETILTSMSRPRRIYRVTRTGRMPGPWRATRSRTARLMRTRPKAAGPTMAAPMRAAKRAKTRNSERRRLRRRRRRSAAQGPPHSGRGRGSFGRVRSLRGRVVVHRRRRTGGRGAGPVGRWPGCHRHPAEERIAPAGRADPARSAGRIGAATACSGHATHAR